MGQPVPRLREHSGRGGSCAPSPACATASGLTDPVLEYSSAADGQGRCSVTGGYVYRGPIPGLQGSYLFGDFCTGELFRGIGAGTHWELSVLLDTGLNISSFGEDEDGGLYVVHYGGAVYRLVEGP